MARPAGSIGLLLLLLLLPGVQSVRTALLPRPTLLRAGAGTAERDPNATSVLLFDTVRVGANVALPQGAGAAFLFRPAKSSAAVLNGVFVADVAGDYVVAFFGPVPAPQSLCNGTPAPGADTAALRVTAWDFAGVETLAGVFLNDIFSHGSVDSTETQYGTWAAPLSGCATEAPGGGLKLRGACELETAAAPLNPFQEPLLLALFGAAPPAAGNVGFALRDAYGLISAPANISLLLSSTSYELTSWTGAAVVPLARGPLNQVCRGAGAAAFDVAFALSSLAIEVTISCAGNGAGVPVKTSSKQPLHYTKWGRGASGAMRLALVTDGSGSGGIAGVKMKTLRIPSEAISETAPVVSLGLFARPELGGSSQPRAIFGVIDVSEQPFAADKTGATDSTAVLQDAFDFCYQYGVTCFLPVGTYTVSDTIELDSTRAASEANAFNHRYYPFVIQGERLVPAAAAHAMAAGAPTRAKIALAPRSPGYKVPSEGKLVLWLRNFGNEDSPTAEEPNSCFNNIFSSIDVAVGEGNFGAIALGWRGAQGVSAEDVTVFAGDGAIGVWGLPGSGGAHSNITVVGGRFGVDGQGSQPGPSASALRVTNASCAGFLYSGVGPLTLVGAAFELAAGVPAVVAGLPLPLSFSGECTLPVMANPQGGTPGHSGGVSLIDARVDYGVAKAATPDSGVGAAAIVTSASLVLSNVFFVNLPPATQAALSVGPSGTGASLGCGGAGGCSLAVVLAAFGNDALAGKPPTGYFDPIYVDGVRTAATKTSNATVFPSGVPPATFPTTDTLLAAHSYSARDFPSFEALGDGRAVCAWDFGAVGDGYTDDGAALQRAIDAAAAAPAGARTVVVPKGMHNTTVGLVLPAGVALVGIGRMLSVVHGSLSGVAPGREGDAGFPPALVYASPMA